MLFVCPLTSITDDQIAEARSLGISCVSTRQKKLKKKNIAALVFLCRASDAKGFLEPVKG